MSEQTPPIETPTSTSTPIETPIESRERALYAEVWSDVRDYGELAPGEQHVPLFVDMAHPDAGDSILDAGCGSGKGALALRVTGLFRDIRLCDFTDAGLVEDARAFPFDSACLWYPLRPQLRYMAGGAVDWVYCCDVLEHVPPTFTMLTVYHLLSIARRGVFLSISLMPDSFGAWVGRPLHLSVQSFVEWRDQLASVGRVRECRDLLHTGLYLVEPVR